MSERGEALLDLHRRVLDQDPTASARLFQEIHRPVIGVLLRSFSQRGLSAEQAGDLATDALMNYLREPEKFNPARSSLFTYLCMIAKGDALNLIAARRRERENMRSVVELLHHERNMVEMETRKIDAEAILSRHATELCDDQLDAEVLKLMLAGERDTEAYAAAIGLGGASAEQKAAAVKQRRDRLEKRLRRLGAEL